MEKKKKNDTAHLEEAFFNNPIASVTDHTGYVVTPVEDAEEADNLAKMMSVPVTTQRHYEETEHETKKKNKEK